MLDTKQKGNETEMECMLAFMKLGHQVNIPFGEDSRYDFIADVNNNMLRIQCKHSSLIIDDNGEIIGIKFKTVRQSGNSANKITRTKYSKEEIDYFATSYCGNCYLVPVEQCSNEKTLRIALPKSNQRKGITFLEDCLLSEVLKTL